MLEAKFCEQEYKRTKTMWHLVNASSHWRKADDPQNALNNTEILFSDSIKEVRLKAALFTTRGGALRDIGQLDEAEDCAHQAIKLLPKAIIHTLYSGRFGSRRVDTVRVSLGLRKLENVVRQRTVKSTRF
ncbi:MAG: hypothetical protein IPL99_03805 [Candidatus Competibacteraceae bacterium]|nr:hypothetical protein [Candidatus Competibacteraceae bacterium]